VQRAQSGGGSGRAEGGDGGGSGSQGDRPKEWKDGNGNRADESSGDPTQVRAKDEGSSDAQRDPDARADESERNAPEQHECSHLARRRSLSPDQPQGPKLPPEPHHEGSGNNESRSEEGDRSGSEGAAVGARRGPLVRGG